MDVGECVRRFAAARVARLATCGSDGLPHLVPVTFAADASTVVLAVDHKPKRRTDLRRLRNVEQNPHVAFLVDVYDDDWDALWWVRADADARVLPDGPEHDAAVDRLVARYPQYAERRPAGPVLVAEVRRWSGWSSAGTPARDVR
jgi:PPOX class probable F420-dependent enzyme